MDVTLSFAKLMLCLSKTGQQQTDNTVGKPMCPAPGHSGRWRLGRLVQYSESSPGRGPELWASSSDAASRCRRPGPLEAGPGSAVRVGNFVSEFETILSEAQFSEADLAEHE